jgi:excinuclease ABC subunit B
MGRAARNERARVILYADRITASMDRAMAETRRRRAQQLRYNEEHGIVPRGIQKDILPGIEREIRAQKVVRSVAGEDPGSFRERERIQGLEREMLEAAEKLEFERAAELRDIIQELRRRGR